MTGVTGRCYCGAAGVAADAAPPTFTYCHCADCRRLSGAPVAAFAAFRKDDLRVSGPLAEASATPGVSRRFCSGCGTQIVATYDYIPAQVYVPVGILGQAGDLAPRQHSHADEALPWFHLSDDLPRHRASGRAVLNAGGTATE